MSECKNCGDPIRWVKSAKTDKPMPMDVENSEQGKFILEATDETDRNGDVIMSATWVGVDDRSGMERFVCHLDSCEQRQPNGGAQGGSTRPQSTPPQSDESSTAYSPAALAIVKSVETLQAMISRLAAKVDHLTAKTDADHRTMMGMLKDIPKQLPYARGEPGEIVDAEMPQTTEPPEHVEGVAHDDDEVPFL